MKLKEIEPKLFQGYEIRRKAWPKRWYLSAVVISGVVVGYYIYRDKLNILSSYAFSGYDILFADYDNKYADDWEVIT